MIRMFVKMYWNSEKGARGKCHTNLFSGQPHGNVDEPRYPGGNNPFGDQWLFSDGMVTAGVVSPIYLNGSEASGQRSLHKARLITRESRHSARGENMVELGRRGRLQLSVPWSGTK